VTSFGRAVRAEWTKLRSVRRWVLGLAAGLLVTVLFSALGASGSSTDLNDNPQELGVVGPDGDRVKDEAHLVYQELTGDGSITARVATQQNSHARAAAGIMLKRSDQPGSAYAATVVTPGHGVRFQANYAVDEPGSAATAPRWLRLTRTGDTVTGYESADGATWSRVGAITLRGLPPTVLVGMVVASPPTIETERNFGSSSVGGRATEGEATFDNVAVEPARSDAEWRDLDTSAGFEPRPYTEEGGTFTIAGSGRLEVRVEDTDVPQLGLTGIMIGQIAVIVIAVLFVTSEYQRGMIRTTFAATPARGRVLAAKATVMGGAAFVVGVVAAVVSFLITQPMLRDNGFGPPGFPVASLWDWPVLRALVGAGILMALVSVVSLAVAVILRRSALAVAGLIVLVLAPIFVGGGLPVDVEKWLVWVTPTAGLSLLQTVEPNPAFPLEPWRQATPGLGLGVLCLYAAVGLAAAAWLLRRRDA
jgi:hypothetical protein